MIGKNGTSVKEKEAMPKAMRWLLKLLIALMVIAFSFANQARTPFFLDPRSDATPIGEPPLFLLILIALIFGMILGGCLVRLGMIGKYKRRPRDTAQPAKNEIFL